MVSRQREWQLRKAAKGLCTSCGEKALPKLERCFRHHALRLLAQAKLPAQGRALLYNRDYILTWLRQHYISVVAGGAEAEEHVARGMFQRHLFNRGRTAESRFWRVVQAIDRLALREKARRY